MNTLHIGIATYEEMKARTLAIARGELKPQQGEPTVWFTSVESVAKILSRRNQELLDLISKQKPESLAQLEELSGRAKSNLSRTLRTMERYGLVELVNGDNGRIVPKVRYDRITLDMAVVSPN